MQQSKTEDFLFQKALELWTQFDLTQDIGLAFTLHLDYSFAILPDQV